MNDIIINAKNQTKMDLDGFYKLIETVTKETKEHLHTLEETIQEKKFKYKK